MENIKNMKKLENNNQQSVDKYNTVKGENVVIVDDVRNDERNEDNKEKKSLDGNVNRQKVVEEEIDCWYVMGILNEMEDYCRHNGYNLLDNKNPNSFISFCRKTSSVRIN